LEGFGVAFANHKFGDEAETIENMNQNIITRNPLNADVMRKIEEF
jgi:hypothetical protein